MNGILTQEKTYRDLGYDAFMRKLPVELRFITSSQNDAFNEVADRSIRAKKLATDALVDFPIPDGSITNGKIANNAITSGKIFSGSVGNSKMSDMAGGTIKGKSGVLAGVPEDLTASQVRTILGIDYGTYTPTGTDVANIAAKTLYECQYARIGNMVTVSGKVDIDPTTVSVATRLGISLPIASNLGAQEDCAGSGFCPDISGLGFSIKGDATNNRAEIEYIPSDAANRSFYFVFSYYVI